MITACANNTADTQQLKNQEPITAAAITEPTESVTFSTKIEPEYIDPPEPPYTGDDIKMLAKMVWGEARGCPVEEQRLVIWAVIQRVDSDGWADTISEVITQKNQFKAYHADNPVDPEIYTLCVNELTDWWNGAHPPTHELYAPTAPYYYFDGDGTNNWFRKEWNK